MVLEKLWLCAVNWFPGTGMMYCHDGFPALVMVHGYGQLVQKNLESSYISGAGYGCGLACLLYGWTMELARCTVTDDLLIR